MRQHIAVVYLALATLMGCEAFYRPGVAPRTYKPEEEVELKANLLKSTKTQLAFNYYDLPFCAPSDRIVTGNKIKNTPYKLALYKEETCKILCRRVYGKQEVAKFKSMINSDYTVNLMADGLPAATHVPIQNSQSTFLTYDHGYHVGGTIRTAGAGNEVPQYYLNNHIRITVLYYQPADSEEALIVGLEVEPFSVDHEPDAKNKPWNDANPPALCQSTLRHKFEEYYPMIIDPNAEENSVVWTYDVRWQMCDIKWANRWDLYLMSSKNDGIIQVHWTSITNSLVGIVFMLGIVAMALKRTLGCDINNHNKALTDEERTKELNETGWKLVHGDVFRPPAMPMVFAATVGSGVQMFVMAISTLLLAFFGIASPAKPDSLAHALFITWVFSSTFGGYGSARTFKLFNGNAKDWHRSTALTALLYPTIIFSALFILDLILWANAAGNALPLSSLLAVLMLWLLVSVPLTFVGAFIGFRRTVVKFPVDTQVIPRRIPAQQWYRCSNVLVVSLGILPFGVVFVELYFILGALWNDTFYNAYGFLMLVFILLVITCAEVSIIQCYVQLRAQDYRWWWRSMLASGSSALYLLFYSIYWCRVKLHAMYVVTYVIIVAYMTTISLAFFLGTGAVGYFAGFWFVNKIYASISVDEKAVLMKACESQMDGSQSSDPLTEMSGLPSNIFQSLINNQEEKPDTATDA